MVVELMLAFADQIYREIGFINMIPDTISIYFGLMKSPLGFLINASLIFIGIDFGFFKVGPGQLSTP